MKVYFLVIPDMFTCNNPGGEWNSEVRGWEVNLRYTISGSTEKGYPLYMEHKTEIWMLVKHLQHPICNKILKQIWRGDGSKPGKVMATLECHLYLAKPPWQWSINVWIRWCFTVKQALRDTSGC